MRESTLVLIKTIRPQDDYLCYHSWYHTLASSELGETDDPRSHLTEQTHYLNVHNGAVNGYKWCDA